MMPTRQAGAAIVMALLVVSIVAMLASSLLWRQDVWISDVGLKRDTAAARLLARNGTDWAQAVLAADARFSAFDHAGEAWAQRVPPTPIEGGEISGVLEDQHAKWNLNNLIRGGRVAPDEIEIFQRLLQGVGLPTRLAHLLGDWLDGDSDVTADGGAEDGQYLALNPPRRAANALLAQVDELRQVQGFSTAAIEKLRPLVTALPEYTAINVNTASRPVLAAALPGLGDADLDLIMSRRQRIPFRDLAEVGALLTRTGTVPDAGRATTVSSFFAATIRASHGDASVELSCLLRRRAGRVDMLWQRYQ